MVLAVRRHIRRATASSLSPRAKTASSMRIEVGVLPRTVQDLQGRAIRTERTGTATVQA